MKPIDSENLVFHSISGIGGELADNPELPLFGLEGRTTVHSGSWAFLEKNLVYLIPPEERNTLLARPSRSYDLLRYEKGWFALKKPVPEELEDQALAWLSKFDRTRIVGGQNDIPVVDVRYLPTQYLLAVIECGHDARDGTFSPKIGNISYIRDVEPDRLQELITNQISRRGRELRSGFPSTREILAKLF